MIKLNRKIKESPIGKTIRIKKRLESGSHIGKIYLNPEMVKYCGKKTTIVGCGHSRSKDVIIYTLKINSRWVWSKEMLELIN